MQQSTDVSNESLQRPKEDKGTGWEGDHPGSYTIVIRKTRFRNFYYLYVGSLRG